MCNSTRLVKGGIKINSDTYNCIGKTYETNRCGNIKIIDINYEKNGHVWFNCEFEDGTKVIACKDNIKKGKVNNPYAKLYFNIGYIGNVNRPSKHPLYNMWTDMMGRCYGNNYKFYCGTTVSKEWHSFENFIKTIKNILGYDEYIKYKDKVKFCIDKDILGHKINYSVQECCFIPHKINTFIAEQKKLNTSGYRGVSWDKERNKWIAQFGGLDTHKFLGRFDSKEEAYIVSKKYRMDFLDNIFANEYNWINSTIKKQCKIYLNSII